MQKSLRAEHFKINKKKGNQNIVELGNTYEPKPNGREPSKQRRSREPKNIRKKKWKRRGGSGSACILYISEELAGRVRDSRLDFPLEDAGRSDWFEWRHEHPPLVVLYAQ